MTASCASAAPRFEDASASLPSPHVYAGGWEHFVGGGVAVLDCNADALPDLFVAGGENRARLFVNVTTDELRFREADVPELTGVTGAYPLDLDADGILDLAVLRAGPNVMLKGDGACGFADRGDALGIAAGNAWTTAFSATWEPGAALPTLAFGNYVDRDDPDGPFGTCDANVLIHPAGARFGAPEALEPGFCALSMLFSDGARGRTGLRISNDRHYYVRGGHEQMWDLVERRFLTEGDGWQRVSLWGMGIASRDLTGDGLPEVMLTSMGDQLLQIAQPDGTYAAAPYEIGTYAQRPFVGDDGRPSTGWHAQFGDVDNDGRADLFIAKGNVDQMPGLAMEDPNNLLMQGADGRFSEAADVAGVASTARARGAALADLDLDGRLDLVVVNRRAPMEIWRNVTADAGNAVTIEPRQPGANHFAVGAWVELRKGDEVQRQEVTVGGGHAGGVAGPLHFGIGSAGTAEIRVIWPNGSAAPWSPVAAGDSVIATRNAEGIGIEAR
nr:CRTAC1 family protein [Citreimonas salinaria]